MTVVRVELKQIYDENKMRWIWFYHNDSHIISRIDEPSIENGLDKIPKY